ncbi:pyruvate dehydrogenase (acetyl-transferring) E1 component subunit alpha [candidate division KSB1 bacterium]|nr:pyruvate dehydrogenase (acetyl-transferring) E1 component subunit alpha [candidate division KSB1 bacterium]
MYEKDFLKQLFHKIYTIRIFETECIKLYRQGLIRGYFHPYVGEEATAVGVCSALAEDDYIISTHRGHGHCIARGAQIDRMVAELLGKKTGYCSGLGGSMHIADVQAGNLGANGIVGGGIPIGVGAALGISIRKEKKVVAIFFSDGAANNGVFAESLNLAAIWNLPAIFLLENNHYAVSTPIEQSSRNQNLYERATGYGVHALAVDGNNVIEVFEQTKDARQMCIKGKGPVLIEAKTYRHGGHHVNDPGAYMPKDRLDYFKSKDPVTIAKKHLKEQGKMSESEIEKIEKEVETTMERAIDFAKESPELSFAEFNQMVMGY